MLQDIKYINIKIYQHGGALPYETGNDYGTNGKHKSIKNLCHVPVCGADYFRAAFVLRKR